MSGSRNQLEQILELLLNEDDKKAEELLHEYVVGKARQEYEKVLDEGDDWDEDEEEFDEYEDDIENDEIGEAEDDEEMSDEEPVDQTDDFIDDISGDAEDQDDDDAEEFDHHDDEGGNDDFEDRVDDLEAELDDLKTEFEKLLGDETQDDFSGDVEDMEGDDFGGDMEGDEEIGDMETDMDDDEEVMDSVEYDLDDKDLEEATQFSQKTSEQPMKGGNLKGSEADNETSPYTDAPDPSSVGNPGDPVKVRDGGEGKKDHGSKPKHQDPTNKNMKVGSKGHGSGYGSGAKKPEAGDKKSPFTKQPK